MVPHDDKDTAMPTKNVLLSSVARFTGLALIAAVITTVAMPSATMAATAAPSQELSVAYRATLATDLSAARRRHHARRTTLRDAFGSIGGGSVTYGAPSYQGYGYGVGDNSRNQTW
jgi:hypothetical protein